LKEKENGNLICKDGEKRKKGKKEMKKQAWYE